MRGIGKVKKMSLAWAVGLCVFSLLIPVPLAAQEAPPTLVSPPNGSTIKGPGSDIAILQWQPVEGAFAYEVRIKQKGAGNDAYVALEEGTEHSFGTSFEGEFQWQVRALYADPEIPSSIPDQQSAFGPWSEKWTFTVKDDIDSIWEGAGIPEVVFPFQGGTLVIGNNYRFHWNPVEGARQYEVCIDSIDGTECYLVHSTNFVFKTAAWNGSRNGETPPVGDYQLRVRAIGENGVGEYCDPVLFQLVNDGDHGPNWNAQGPIPTPVLLAPPDGSTIDPTPDMFLTTLQWEPVTGASYYEVIIRSKQQRQGDNLMEQAQNKMGSPPSSILTEEPFYDLVVPDAKPGDEFFWRVRAIVKMGKVYRPSPPSGDWWSITVGTPQEPEVVGEPLIPDSFDYGVSFTGPGAVVQVGRKGLGASLYQVLVLDDTGNRVLHTYRHGTGWDIEIPENGGYHVHIRQMDMDRNGQVVSMTPLGQGRWIEVSENSIVDGGRQVGDLVNDGTVDSGDAIRALRHSSGQNSLGLTLRDAASGDYNGDGLIDSGDAVYMLKKAVGSNR